MVHLTKFSFVFSSALRKTMLRAHRQAWCWQDEYYGLTIGDIRALELETQRALHDKMSKFREAEENDDGSIVYDAASIVKLKNTTLTDTSVHVSNVESTFVVSDTGSTKRISWGETRTRKAGAWKVESLEKLRSDSSSEDEFFDAHSNAGMKN